MAGISKAEDAGGIVVFAKEERGVRAVRGVFAEELVHRAQETVGLVVGNGAETAQIRLQVGHQECGGDSFAGDVCYDEAKPVLAEVEEIVIIATDLASLDADAGVFQSGEGWHRLREEAGTDGLCEFKVAVGRASAVPLLRRSSALRFPCPG